MILVPPIIGIANNGDFERLSQKFGVFNPYNAWDTEHYSTIFFHNIVITFKNSTPISTNFFRHTN